jgi:tetratricopeptide (TPR) repeat protein
MKISISAKLIFNILLSIAITGGIIALQKPQLNSEQKTNTEKYNRQDLKEKTTAILLAKMPSFGYDNMVANWAFLKFLVYFGDGDVRKHTGYAATTDYFKTVVKNDPRFVKAYFYMSPATSMFAGNPEQSTTLIEQGLASITPQSHPDSYFLWIYKAIDELLFLGDSQAAKHSYDKGIEWASYYNDDRSKAVSARMQQMSQFLATNPDSVEAQIGSWFQLLTNAKDDVTRRRAVDNIEKLGGKIQFTPNGVTVTVPEEHRRT